MTEDDTLLADEQLPEGEQAEQQEQSEDETEGKEKPEGESETETEGDADEDESKDKSKDGDEADDSDKDDEDEEADKPKRPSRKERYQRRIERLERENTELRSRTPASQSDSDLAAEVEKVIGKAPKEDDYKGDYLAFERALTAYELDKRQVTREVKSQSTRQQAMQADRRREAAEAHQDRVEEFRSKTKDFDKVLSESKDLKASPTIEELILDSDLSANLVYFLAKNPQRLDRLNDMSEREAARELGRIEARLSLPAPKTQTKAPKPVTPPKGGAAPNSPDRDLDAWLSKKYGKK